MAYANRLQENLFFCSLVVTMIFCSIYTLHSYYTRISAIRKPMTSKFKLIGDVVTALPKPNLGSAIFFIDTTYSELHTRTNTIPKLTKPAPLQLNVVNLTARAACAVESAALHNPNSDIFVLFASPVYCVETNENPIINAILSYKNVQLRNLDLWSYSAGTPVEKWLQADELFRSRYLVSHMSDFLRYLTLWRFGGTYLDMDVIVLRSLEGLPPNYVGAESETHLAAGVMNFGYDNIGRKVADYCLKDFQHNFDGRDWGTNGPGVITRTMKHFCQTDQIARMFDRKRCSGFQVYQQTFFYAVHSNEWSHFFDETEVESTLKRIGGSYVTHVWNKHSKQRKVRNGDRNAFLALAAMHCPKVFGTIKSNLN